MDSTENSITITYVPFKLNKGHILSFLCLIFKTGVIFFSDDTSSTADTTTGISSHYLLTNSFSYQMKSIILFFERERMKCPAVFFYIKLMGHRETYGYFQLINYFSFFFS